MTLITPNTFGLQVEVVYGENAVLDAEEYSMSKAGFDPSETFAVREYRAGDHIHQIHWKLSEKLDGLIVRDYGLPVQNTILLLLETGYPEKSRRISIADGKAGRMSGIGFTGNVRTADCT